MVQGSSPFGPAADRADRANRKVLVPSQMVADLKKYHEDTEALLGRQRKRIADLEQRLGAEIELRRAAERKFLEAADLLREGEDLQAYTDTAVEKVLEEFAALPGAAEAAELARLLEESEADRATLRALLEESDAERLAALRARDALAARLRPREDGSGDDADVRALRARLEAPTFAGVLDLARQHCACLAVTADPAESQKLDHHTKAGQWRSRLADSLATMQMYAEEKNAARATGPGGTGAAFANLRAYCSAQSTPLLSDQKVAHYETATARDHPRGASARTFRVPAEVSPNGTAVMNEHIRIGEGKPPAPRLHFLDDTDRSGLIVVGYVGDHLYNAQTN